MTQNATFIAQYMANYGAGRHDLKNYMRVYFESRTLTKKHNYRIIFLLLMFV